MAGAEGFEPPSSVLETDSLTVELTPLLFHPNLVRCSQDPSRRTLGMTPAASFNLFMRRVLTATAAELLKLQPLRHRLPILRLRVVPLFAITALPRKHLSGHKNGS